MPKQTSKYRFRPRHPLIEALTTKSFQFHTRFPIEQCVFRLEGEAARDRSLSITVDELSDGPDHFFRLRRRRLRSNLMVTASGYLEPAENGTTLITGNVSINPDYVPWMILIGPYFRSLFEIDSMMRRLKRVLPYSTRARMP